MNSEGLRSGSSSGGTNSVDELRENEMEKSDKQPPAEDRCDESGEPKKGARELAGTNSSNATPKDWRKLFVADPDQTLQFFPPKHENGKVIVVPPSEIYDEGVDCWKNTVVGQFIGRTPNFSFLQRMAKTLWGTDGDVDIKPAGPNTFIIQLPNSLSRDRVLEGGPWHIQNIPLIVRKWEPDMESLDFNMKKLPIWIHLRNVPLELFTKNGLSYLASAVGNPLYMDRITANKQRLAFAKICVEVDASSTIPRVIEVRRRNGVLVNVTVELPWWPQRCTKCCLFGHMDRNCPHKVNVPTAKVWIPKSTEQDVVDSGAVTKETDKEIKGSKNVQSMNERGKDKKETEVEIKRVETRGENTGSSSGSSAGKAGSTNRFAILAKSGEAECVDKSGKGRDYEAEVAAEENQTIGARKTRAAAAGVAEIMKSLKATKKGPIDKGKTRNKVLRMCLLLQQLSFISVDG